MESGQLLRLSSVRHKDKGPCRYSRVKVFDDKEWVTRITHAAMKQSKLWAVAAFLVKQSCGASIFVQAHHVGRSNPWFLLGNFPTFEPLDQGAGPCQGAMACLNSRSPNNPRSVMYLVAEICRMTIQFYTNLQIEPAWMIFQLSAWTSQEISIRGFRQTWASRGLTSDPTW